MKKKKGKKRFSRIERIRVNHLYQYYVIQVVFSLQQ